MTYDETWVECLLRRLSRRGPITEEEHSIRAPANDKRADLSKL